MHNMITVSHKIRTVSCITFQQCHTQHKNNVTKNIRTVSHNVKTVSHNIIAVSRITTEQCQ